MGGITSASMPVIVVRDAVHGNEAYCNLNEGIGQSDALWRLRPLTCKPVCAGCAIPSPGTQRRAKAPSKRGLDLSALMAQAITMGDEFHPA